MSIWCEGSSEKVYAAVKVARCPICHKMVDVTERGHIKPHVENKTAGSPTASKK